MIQLFNLKNELLNSFVGYSGVIYFMKQLNENQIITCSNDKTIKIWDINTSNCKKTLLGHSSDVFSFILCSNERIISIWNGNCIGEDKTEHKDTSILFY